MKTEILGEKTYDLLEKTGLNWTVEKLPLFSGTGLKTESHGIFRNDNEEWLGTVGNRYEPLQNHSLAETIIKASDGIGLTADRGGMLNGGRHTYLQAQLPDEFIGKSNIKRLITGLNSHDGSSSIGFGSTNTVVICENTFYMALRGLQKFKHTISAEKRIEIVMNDMRVTMEKEGLLMNKFKQMANLHMEDEIVERVINKIFAVKTDVDSETLSTRKKNQVLAFGNSVRQSIREQGNTVWALFNGVTRYTNHLSAPPTKEGKQEYIMMGGGYEIANKSFNEIMSWVDARTEKKTVFAVTN